MLSIPGFITIRFIKSEKNADDDIITIRPSEARQVSVTMTGATTTRESATHAALRMSHDDCLRWLVRTTNLLSTDDYPIDYVQFDFPFCPTVLYKLENLDQHMHVVYDMLAFQLSVWAEPVRPTPIEIPPPQELSAYEDDLNTAFIKEDEGAAAGRHSQQKKGRHHLFFDELA